MRTSTSSSFSPRRGFTLVELLVVVAIIAILIMILLPAIQAAREAARKSQCINQLNQLTKATLNYECQTKKFPPGMWGPPFHNTTEVMTGSWVGEIALLLPYMEASRIGKEVLKNLNKSPTATPWWGVPKLTQLATENISFLICPSDQINEDAKLPIVTGIHCYFNASSSQATFSFYTSPSLDLANGYKRTSYVGIGGVEGDIGAVSDKYAGLFANRAERMTKNIKDGTSYSMAFGECCAREDGTRLFNISWFCGPMPTMGNWPGSGAQYPLDGKKWCQFSSAHPHTVNFAFIDGSVHSINTDIGGMIGRAANFPDPSKNADICRNKTTGDLGEMILNDLSGINDHNESIGTLTESIW
jgi:prepilin-type N-terminal cleavage/methylation domain-containing protein/prepilin-type processing-associated H-X9-DG protein